MDYQTLMQKLGVKISSEADKNLMPMGKVASTQPEAATTGTQFQASPLPSNLSMSAYSGGGGGLSAEERALKKKLSDKLAQMYQQQEQTASEASGLYSNYKAKPVDMEKYASVLNSLDFAGYSPSEARGLTATIAPPTEEEKTSKLKELLALQLGAEDKVTDNVFNQLKTLDDNAKESKSAGQMERFLLGKEMQAFEPLRKDFKKIEQDYSSTFSSLSGIESAVKAGTVFDIQSQLSNLARASGEKGVLTDQDIARVLPSNLKTKYANVISYLRSDPEAKMPDEVVKALKENIGRLREVMTEKFLNDAKNLADDSTVGPLSYGKFGEGLYNKLEKRHTDKMKQESTAKKGKIKLI